MDAFEVLIPAYALDALDNSDRREFEAHLATCEHCRTELRAYRDTTSLLSYALPLTEPPTRLREKILRDARHEVTSESKARGWFRQHRRYVGSSIVVAAAAAAILVAVYPHGDGNDNWVRTATNRVALSGGKGVVVVSGHRGALLTSLGSAPPGRTYEAWVVRGKKPIAAGTFRSGGGPFILTVPVGRGDTVAVTVEPADGSPAPTSPPILSARI